MINIQEMMKELFGGSCYGYCLTRQFSKSDDIKTLTSAFLEGWKRGYVDDDGYVSNPLKYIRLVGGPDYRDVEKVSINSLKDLPDDNDWIVEYKKKPTDKASHFVIANRKKGVIFDPSGDSVTVKVGSPFSYRKFIV